MLEQLPSPNMSGPILVIDDEPYILRSLSYLLQREGYTVETAVNGAEGLQRVRSLRPPLVFLDIMMPHMNGYEVCEQVKQDPSLEERTARFCRGGVRTAGWVSRALHRASRWPTCPSTGSRPPIWS